MGKLILGILASGRLGCSILRQLHQQHSISFVMTDKHSSDIREFCEMNSIDCFVGNPRSGKSASFVTGRSIDVLVSVNYLFLIEQDLINIPKKLAFNIHGSLLPKYRGRTPHVWAIINNESITGITAHLIEKACDAGDIIAQVQVPIEREDTGAIILGKFEVLYPKIINDVLEKIQGDKLIRRPQEDELASYFGKRTPDDGKINWSWQRERVRNWVRAQAYPYPGAFSFHGDEKIVIDEVIFDDFGFDSEMPDGLVLTVSPLRIKTPNGVLRLTKIRDCNAKFIAGITLK